MATFWENFDDLFREAQEAAGKDALQPGRELTTSAAFARLTKEEFRLARAAEDEAAGLGQSPVALAARVERYEDALWGIVELAREQEKLIEHRRSRNGGVSDVDVARWLAFRKAAKKATEALGIGMREVQARDLTRVNALAPRSLRAASSLHRKSTAPSAPR